MATCGGCGGAGGRWEYYTDPKTGLIKNTWIPCGACGGSGQT